MMRRSGGSFASGIAEGVRAREAVIFVRGRPTFLENPDLQEDNIHVTRPIKFKMKVHKFILWLDLSHEEHPSKLPI